MKKLKYRGRAFPLFAALITMWVLGCMKPQPIPGVYVGQFSWDGGLKDVSVTLQSDHNRHLDLSNKEIHGEIESLIQKAVAQSNVRSAQGTFTISIIGFSPMLIEVKRFVIESPNFERLLAYVESENIDQIKRSIQSDHNVNQRGPMQRTALYEAAAGSKARAVTALLELGADPNIADFEGDTPLIMAVTADSPEVARMLILSGAKVNQADQVGTTPLMRAAEFGRLHLLTLLLQSGAYPNYVAPDGDSALRIALAKQNKATIAVLRRHGASK